VRAPQTASVNPQIHFGSEAIGLLLNPLYQLFLRHVVDCRFVVHVDVGRFVLPEPAPVEQASYHGHTVLKWWPTITPSRKARPQPTGRSLLGSFGLTNRSPHARLPIQAQGHARSRHNHKP